MIKEISPKVFIYENVRAVISHDGGRTWEKMQQVFSELGYDFSWDILNAKNYGIPQNRERLFVVGFKKDLGLEEHFSFPKPIPLKKKMQDFLIEKNLRKSTEKFSFAKRKTSNIIGMGILFFSRKKRQRKRIFRS